MVVKRELFLRGLESIEERVASHKFSTALFCLPPRVGSAGILCTFLQRWLTKLEEFGHKSDRLAVKASKCGKSKRAFEYYGTKVFVLTIN